LFPLAHGSALLVIFLRFRSGVSDDWHVATGAGHDGETSKGLWNIYALTISHPTTVIPVHAGISLSFNGCIASKARASLSRAEVLNELSSQF
jgi:hypothetical protein